MQYFFILGNNPTLSVAEIFSVFNLEKENEIKSANLIPEAKNVLIIKINEKINCSEIIKKLGGIIKIGEIIFEENNNNQKKILEKIKTILNPKDGKFKFGISYYGREKINIKPLAMEIKKYLKEKKISCRWVIGREKTLSSVIVKQNKLDTKGSEIILISNNNKILIGKTLTVQPFKELSFRDYGRPARDDYSGMLPPKLAQIMINLSCAKYDSLILDPFCGSGTILTEAMLMDYKNIIGSDISKKAIENTLKNIEWIKEKFNLPNINLKLYNQNVLKLTKFIQPKSIDAIITEPYLGPQRGKYDINKIIKELEKLYSESLEKFQEILKLNGKIVMALPVFKEKNYINPNLHNFKIIHTIPKKFQENKIINITNRNTIVYGRPGQKVWREIIVLKKSAV